MTTSTGVKDIQGARFWDGIAEKYAAAPIRDPRSYEIWLARVAEHIGPDAHVLELGCGTGSTALKLSPLVKTYLATDFAANMIEIANSKLTQDSPENLRFLQADPFDPRIAPPRNGPEDGYDAILGFNFLHLVEDMEAVARQAFDMLKPGGLFITKTVCLKRSRWLFGPLIAALRAFGKAPKLHFISETDVEKMLDTAGFTLLETQTFGKKVRGHFVVARKPKTPL
ncbi:class I SAM-dependent methyltransferase [Roseibium sp. RKSG952]|uniref:class I SAM-dependent DNA methyltransferase n=1 Tax=Roseibium sp. RKSG952 TaxID=2529384 RepID=UPI0012BD25E5|nr:class I SAM-dependent methyltransferase [Roseibium sp. RKSG952]MTH99893.1 class I SAM-dependent methyltransferase [Roseibium sp. RKSG952]